MAPHKVRSDVFHAIADPNRRALLGFLAREPKPVGDCVDALGISYSAVSQHLGVLRAVGLVERQSLGRQRLYHSQFGPLQAVHDWTEQYRPFWTDRLSKLKTYLDDHDSEDCE